MGRLVAAGLTLSIYPVDVIKSKLQTDTLDKRTQRYKGMIDCARQVWRAQGWRGFTGGLAPTLIRWVVQSRLDADAVRSPFANGATFVAFELAMRAMG